MKRTILTLLMTLLAITNAYSKVTYLHSNPLGSIVAATDETGKQLWVKRYTPFGIESEANGAVNDKGANHGFATHEVDKETGLVYMKARYYDPEVGRFFSVDPLGMQEMRTRTFHPFMYGENNPQFYVDPNGKEVAYLGVNINLFGLGVEVGGFVTFPGFFNDPYDIGLYSSPVITRPLWMNALLPGPDPVTQGSSFGEGGYMHNTGEGFFDLSNLSNGFRAGNVTLATGGSMSRSYFDGLGVETCAQYGAYGACGAYNTMSSVTFDVLSGAKVMYGPQFGVSNTVTYTGSYTVGDAWSAWSGFVNDSFSHGDWYGNDSGWGGAGYGY